MKQIDEDRLESDAEYRFTFLCEFIGFHQEDIDAVHKASSFLAPLVPSLVDAVYEKLQSCDSTWRHFLPRQAGYEGEIPESLADLTPDHPQISFRKKHLGRYLEALVTKSYDTKMVTYLDHVGEIHTPTAGNPEIVVPLVQMNALMGFVSDAILHAILTADLPAEEKTTTARAFMKLLWIQNDLISRHYDAHATSAEKTDLLSAH